MLYCWIIIYVCSFLFLMRPVSTQAHMRAIDNDTSIGLNDTGFYNEHITQISGFVPSSSFQHFT